MSFLFGTRMQPSPPQKTLGLFDSSSATIEQGNPLPYLAGKRRFSGTFITDAYDIRAVPVGGGGKNSGKGGGGTGTNYFAGVGIGWCLGQVDGFHDFLLNGDEVFTSNSPINCYSLSQVNNVASFVATAGHGLTTGDSVLIEGASQPEFNGEFEVTVLNTNTFTYVIPGSSILVQSAYGAITAYAKLDPIYRAGDTLSITIPGYGVLNHYWGTETQPADNYLQVSGTNHPPMHGVCYSSLEQFFIGLNQTNIQNAEVVLSRCPNPAWLNQPGVENNIQDEANPACVFYDLLTHPRASFRLTDIDFNLQLLAAAATQLYNEGFGVSVLLTRFDAAQTTITQLCETIDAIPALDANKKLYLQLIRAPVDYTTAPVITDAMLTALPKNKSVDWSNTHSKTILTFPNRDAAYLSDFVQWEDFAAFSSAQSASIQTVQNDMITRRDLAATIVAAKGPAEALPAQSGELSLAFSLAQWSSLAPGTLFNYQSTFRPSLSGYYRVTTRSFPDPSKPEFTIQYAAERSYLNFAH